MSDTLLPGFPGADSMIRDITVRHPELTIPPKHELDHSFKHVPIPGDDRFALMEPQVAYMVKQWLRIESEFSKRGDVVAPEVHYTVGFNKNENGETVNGSRAVVRDQHDRVAIIEPTVECVFDFVLGDPYCTVADRVCVAAYLVAVLSMIVSFDSRAIGVIRHLISFMRLHATVDRCDSGGGCGEEVECIHVSSITDPATAVGNPKGTEQ